MPVSVCVSTASGRVGIGESSPATDLHITNSGATQLLLESGTSSQGILLFGDADDLNVGSVMYDHSDNSMRFETSDSERMRIDSSGNLLVGTTSAFGTNVLNVDGGIAIDGRNASTPGLCEKGDVDTGIFWPAANSLSVATGGTERLRVDSSGNVGIGTTSVTNALGWASVAQVGGANPALSLKNTSNVQWDISNFGGTFNIYNGSNNRLKIDSSGNVGIGTTNPLMNLHLSDTGDTGIQITKDGSVASRIKTVSGALAIGVDGANGDTERMRIDSSGNVGIGTGGDNPTALFEVEAASNPEISIASSAGATNNFLNFKAISHSQQIQTQLKVVDQGDFTADLAFLFKASGTSGALSEKARLAADGTFLIGCTGQTGDAPSSDGFLFQQIGNVKIRVNSDGQACQQYYSPTGGTSGPVGGITVNASSTAFNTTSDQRAKENIVDAPSASDDIDAIQVRSFDWKADGSHQKYGMVAQELQSVAPEAVSGDADSDEMMAVDYSKLVPMLVKEIQSLRARVQQLENG